MCKWAEEQRLDLHSPEASHDHNSDDLGEGDDVEVAAFILILEQTPDALTS